VRRALALPAVVAVLVCGLAAPAAAERASGRRLRIVAAESAWGSVVRQLAGRYGTVDSIISNPDTDPHDYEARPSDARRLASAEYVVVNGAGYDAWARKLLDADDTPDSRVLDVGRLAGVPAGANPHLWYSPTVVEQVVARVTADLRRLDHAHAAYFAARRADFETRALASYHGLIAAIRRDFAGRPVGASESVFTPLARALGLRVLTPRSFLDAVAEGTDPTAADKSTVDAQIARHEIEVFVYNTQNATPDVNELVRSARAKGIPVTDVTETLTPTRATFQSWQTRQLAALQRALVKGTGT
jgi:zinc/manganese transport system substrate-binding protein